MDSRCPQCGVSLAWRIMRARYVSLSETHYVCPCCGTALRQNPWPIAYNVASLWITLPFAALFVLVTSETAVSWVWWPLIAILAGVALLGYRRSMRSVAASFRRYEKA